jgi:short-subunit dehydrogenase
MARAIVTGASSGLGREIAIALADRGDDVLAVARSESAIAELAASNAKVTALAADLATREGRDAVVRTWDETDLLVNNAGFGAVGRFHESDPQIANEMVEVNVDALTDLTGRYLSGMVERGRGALLNVASTAAFQPGPRMAVYYATKAYVLSFTEAVAHELRGTGVTATVFCPGAFESGFQARAGAEDLKLIKGRRLPTSAEMAAAAIAAMDAGKAIEVPGAFNKVGAASVRFAPRFLVRHMVDWVDS